MSVKKTTTRMNSHVFFHQKEYVMKMAKLKKKSTAEMFREIIDFYMKNNE